MKICLTTACLVAVALGTPDHMPHTVQTDKKPLAKGQKAKVQDEIKKIEPIILHSKMSKDQEAQLAKDVSEVEKMRKALAKMKHEATEVKVETEATKVAPVAKQAAKVEEKKVAAPPIAVAPKEAVAKEAVAKVAVPKAEVPKAPLVAAPKVAEAKVAEPKSDEKKVVAKSEIKPEVKPVVHEKKAVAPAKSEPMHHDVAKSPAAAKMKERLAEAEAKGEKMAIEKMSSNTYKHKGTTMFKRIPVMRPRNFAKTVAQWEAANPVGSKGLLHTGRVHLSRAHLAALPVVKALPWVSAHGPATTDSANATAVAVSFGAEKKASSDAASPEVIAKFTESAQASAERAQKHLEEAKKAFAKTSANADQIHETGKKIEKTAGTIKYLYSTPKPPAPPTTQAPAPKEKSAANSPRSFLLVAGFLALGGSIWAC